MKSKNLLTLFACLVLIITTAINLSIYKNQSQVLGQSTSLCQRIGGFCSNTCTPSSSVKCLAGKWLGCSTLYCARKTSTPTAIVPTKANYPTPTKGIYPTAPPVTKSPPSPPITTVPGLGYIPCYEMEKIMASFCQKSAQTPTPALTTISPIKTPAPTIKLVPLVPTSTPVIKPTVFVYPSVAPTITKYLYPTATPARSFYQ